MVSTSNNQIVLLDRHRRLCSGEFGGYGISAWCNPNVVLPLQLPIVAFLGDLVHRSVAGSREIAQELDCAQHYLAGGGILFLVSR